MEPFDFFASTNKDHIVFTKRQASMIMASMLLSCLFVFVVGFFLGKRTIIDDFSSKLTKDALHDQIDFLLTTQSLESSEEDQTEIKVPLEGEQVLEEKEPAARNENSDSLAIKTQDSLKEIPVVKKSEKYEKIVDVKNKEKSLVTKTDTENKQYARLIGFGTKRAAQSFVSRLKKRDIPVILKTIVSKTSSGKQKVWYQAITPTFNSSKELKSVVDKVKRFEHIKDSDIQIVNTK